jgi:hypothetical protein
MVANMDRIVHGLPGTAAMYGGHEYTVANLRVRPSLQPPVALGMRV